MCGSRQRTGKLICGDESIAVYRNGNLIQIHCDNRLEIMDAQVPSSSRFRSTRKTSLCTFKTAVARGRAGRAFAAKVCGCRYNRGWGTRAQRERYPRLKRSVPRSSPRPNHNYKLRKRMKFVRLLFNYRYFFVKKKNTRNSHSSVYDPVFQTFKPSWF